jgi:hypothetical protein
MFTSVLQSEAAEGKGALRTSSKSLENSLGPVAGQLLGLGRCMTTHTYMHRPRWSLGSTRCGGVACG